MLLVALAVAVTVDTSASGQHPVALTRRIPPPGFAACGREPVALCNGRRRFRGQVDARPLSALPCAQPHTHAIDVLAGQCQQVVHTALRPVRRGRAVPRPVRSTTQSWRDGRLQPVPGFVRAAATLSFRKHLPSRLAKLREIGLLPTLIRAAKAPNSGFAASVAGDIRRSIGARAHAAPIMVRTWRPPLSRHRARHDAWWWGAEMTLTAVL